MAEISNIAIEEAMDTHRFNQRWAKKCPQHFVFLNLTEEKKLLFNQLSTCNDDEKIILNNQIEIIEDKIDELMKTNWVIL